MNPLPVTALRERTFCVRLDFFFSYFFINSFHIFPCLSISGVSAENIFCFFFFVSGLVHISYYSCYLLFFVYLHCCN